MGLVTSTGMKLTRPIIILACRQRLRGRVADLDSSACDGSQRIDIAVHENGISATIRKIHQAAKALQVLSPEAAMSLRGEALRLGEHLETVVKGAAVVALQTAVQTSPVDTGMLRANWQV